MAEFLRSLHRHKREKIRERERGGGKEGREGGRKREVKSTQGGGAGWGVSMWRDVCMPFYM